MVVCNMNIIYLPGLYVPAEHIRCTLVRYRQLDAPLTLWHVSGLPNHHESYIYANNI